MAQLGKRAEGEDLLRYIQEGKAEADAQQKLAKLAGKNCVFAEGKKR